MEEANPGQHCRAIRDSEHKKRAFPLGKTLFELLAPPNL